MTVVTERPGQAAIRRHLNVINIRLMGSIGRAIEVANMTGDCRYVVPGYAGTQLVVGIDGWIGLSLLTSAGGFLPEHYQLMAWDGQGGLVAVGGFEAHGWQLAVRCLGEVVQLRLQPVDRLAIADVRQLGHGGWLSPEVVRWGVCSRPTLNSQAAEIYSLAWIDPRAVLANHSDYQHPYYAELTEQGWRMNACGQSIRLQPGAPLEPMIAAVVEI